MRMRGALAIGVATVIANPSTAGAEGSRDEITGWLRGQIEHEMSRLVSADSGMRMAWKWRDVSFDGCSFSWTQTTTITANDPREDRKGQILTVGYLESTYTGKLSTLYFPPEIRAEKPHQKANFDLYSVTLRTINGEKVVTHRHLVENAVHEKTSSTDKVAELAVSYLSEDDAKRVAKGFSNAIQACSGKAVPVQ